MDDLIVKIQRPLAGALQFLIYNEDKSITQFVPVEGEVGEDILKQYFQDDELKVYVEASITDKGMLWLDELSEDQDPGW